MHRRDRAIVILNSLNIFLFPGMMYKKRFPPSATLPSKAETIISIVPANKFVNSEDSNEIDF